MIFQGLPKLPADFEQRLIDRCLMIRHTQVIDNERASGLGPWSFGYLMQELAKIRRVIEKELPGAPHETLLVIDGTTGQNGVSQAQAFLEAAQVTGIVITKLDGTAKGGVVLSIMRQFNIPVKFVGVGESADDLIPFDPEAFLDTLFES